MNFGVVVLFWHLFYGFRAPGGKKARQETTARKDRKDGWEEEGREGRKGQHFCSKLRGNTGRNGTFRQTLNQSPNAPKP